MKNNRSGQAAIITDADYTKVRKCLKSKKYRLMLDIARYTGERWGAIVQLAVSDVYDCSWQPHDHITFRAVTRKASPNGKRATRQVPLHPLLKELLEVYRHTDASGWLFPSRVNPTEHVTLRAADLMLRGAIAAANLSHKGYSTHSTRRTFITYLYNRGVDLHTIQLITGHQDLKSLIRYIQADPDRVKKAIAVL